MNSRCRIASNLLFLLSLGALFLLSSSVALPALAFRVNLSQVSPIAPSQSEPSDAANKAAVFIARRYGIPQDLLTVAYDRPTELQGLGRRFQAVTLLDTRPEGRTYKVLVDLSTGDIEENIYSLATNDSELRQARYGKLQPALFQRLQKVSDEEQVRVAVWVKGQANQTLVDQQRSISGLLASKYPEVATSVARSGSPFDVGKPELHKKIEADYLSLLKGAMTDRIRNLAEDLERRGFALTKFDGVPTVASVLPKKAILDLGQREDVEMIYLIEGEPRPALDSAIPSSLAPAVWARGIDGNGYITAIVERGNIDPGNSYLHLVNLQRNADRGIVDHTTRVASAAASYHPAYRGMAPAAAVLSAGTVGTMDDTLAAFQWAFDLGANTANYSEEWSEDTVLNYLDRAFDYKARQTFRFISVVSGNS